MLEIVKHPTPSDILLRKERWKNHTLIGNYGTKTYVINKNGRKIAEIYLDNFSMQVYQNKLYTITNDKQLIEIDLNQIESH